MAKSIRDVIVELFKGQDAPLTLSEIAKHLQVSVEEVRSELMTAPKLSSLSSLSPQDALAMIDFYGEGVLFDDKLESTLQQYRSTRGQLDRIERKLEGG